MNTGLISSRYADSLLQYAVSLGQEEEVYDKMKLLSEIFMKMPRLRSAILMTACGGSMPSSLSKMIDLILKNEREEVLQYIALRFIDLYRDKFDIQSGRLVTAISIDHKTGQQLVTRIQKMVKTNVEIESVVDSEIIGGFILTLGDFRWDASVSGELTRIRNKFRKD